MIGCVCQQCLDVLFGFRPGHAVGKMRKGAAAQANPIRQALPMGTLKPLARVVAHQRMPGQPRSRHAF
jgi:hypothetical protein